MDVNTQSIPQDINVEGVSNPQGAMNAQSTHIDLQGKHFNIQHTYGEHGGSTNHHLGNPQGSTNLHDRNIIPHTQAIDVNAQGEELHLQYVRAVTWDVQIDPQVVKTPLNEVHTHHLADIGNTYSHDTNKLVQTQNMQFFSRDFTGETEMSNRDVNKNSEPTNPTANNGQSHVNKTYDNRCSCSREGIRNLNQ